MSCHWRGDARLGPREGRVRMATQIEGNLAPTTRRVRKVPEQQPRARGPQRGLLPGWLPAKIIRSMTHRSFTRSCLFILPAHDASGCLVAPDHGHRPVLPLLVLLLLLLGPSAPLPMMMVDEVVVVLKVWCWVVVVVWRGACCAAWPAGWSLEVDRGSSSAAENQGPWMADHEIIMMKQRSSRTCI